MYFWASSPGIAFLDVLDVKNGNLGKFSWGLKKSLSKSIKNFNSKSIFKVSHLDFRGSVKKLLNSSKITKTHQIYYWISYVKNQGFEKTPLFYVDFTKNKFSDINFWWILINFFFNLKRISPSFHFSRLKRPRTRSLLLSSKITCYGSGFAHIYEFPGYPKAVSGGSPHVNGVKKIPNTFVSIPKKR